MDFGGAVDSSGTDDDLPPPYQNNRGMKGSGRITGNGRDTIGAGPYTRVQQPQTDMETQIHHLEQEAYCSVLRAFKAQSDAITWEKESLITELRKELRVSDKEHRELLNGVNSDDIIRRIREWRESTGVLQMNPVNNAQRLHDPVPSPTTSARKRQKTSQPIPSASVPAPSAMHSQPIAAPIQPSSSGAKKAAPPGSKVKKNKPDLYALVYDMNTAHETWEWVDFKEMAPEDVRWEGEEPDLNLLGRGAAAHGVKKSTSRGGPMLGAGRGRGPQKNSFKKDYPPSQNGVGKKSSDYIEILHTETLIKEVERVFSAGNPDPLEMERSKKVLKEHEQSLIDAIARLAEASDGECADDHARSLEYNRGWRNQHGGRYADDMAIDVLMSGDADAM
ncbi:protein EMSY-LIKE 1-like isoform X5 [Panicum virgatum]|uniref:protein EMSY-LIKE 1-like isoform X5 n=1 Tax=Panicum virgatum TaxID=38727 RepID=UPI0019D682F1|nr:protein EMSY-LIKE 1-like isoform X5 [Panicum virgatum]